MRSKIYAVIDTNVLVSALISKSIESNPMKVFRAIIQDKIIPLYNDEILSEYNSVLSRDKFHLDRSLIKTVLKAIVTDGLSLDRTTAADVIFPEGHCVLRDRIIKERVLSGDWQHKAFSGKTVHSNPVRNGPHIRIR